MKRLLVFVFAVALLGSCDFLLSETDFKSDNGGLINNKSEVQIINKIESDCYTEIDIKRIKSIYKDSIKILKQKNKELQYEIDKPVDRQLLSSNSQVLYLNWKNKLRISTSGYKPENIKLMSTGCYISGPDSKGFYIASVTNVRAKEVELFVSAIDETGEEVELTNEIFKIFPLPKPIAKFAGKAGGNLKKVNAVSYSTIKANLGDSPLNIPYKVVSFKMFTTKNGQPIEYKSKSNKLTPEMRNALKKIPKGGSLVFTGIDVINEANGKKTRLEAGIVLKLI